MGDELKTIKFQLMLSPSEAAAIDDWGFKNRIRTRAEAIRRLCQIGILFDQQADDLESESKHLSETMGQMIDIVWSDKIELNLEWFLEQVLANHGAAVELKMTINTMLAGLSSLRKGGDLDAALLDAKSAAEEMRAAKEKVIETFANIRSLKQDG